MTQPWPGNLRRTARDCLWTPGPGRQGLHWLSLPGWGPSGLAQPNLGPAASERELEESMWVEGSGDLPPEPGRRASQVALGSEEDQRAQGSPCLLSLPGLVRNKSKINYVCLLLLLLKMVSSFCPLPPPFIFIKLSFLLSKQVSMQETPPGGSQAEAASQPLVNLHSDGRWSGAPTGEAAWGSGCAGRGVSVSREGRAAKGLVLLSWGRLPRRHLTVGWCGQSLAHGGHHAGRVGVTEGEAGGGVDGRRRGQDVSRVAEGRQVAHGCHVSGQGSRAEGGGLFLHALGQLLEALGTLLVLLGLVGHLPVPSLDAFLLHGQWPVYIVQLVVEATGVADRVPVGVSAP